MRILAKTGILTHKCVYVIVQSQQSGKKKSAALSHRNRDGAHTALLFAFQQLKIGCFKTAVLKNACPFYRCSPSFSSDRSPPASVSHSRPVVACKDRSHPNDEKVLL